MKRILETYDQFSEDGFEAECDGLSVGGLVELLSNFSPSLPVVIAGQNGGYEFLTVVKTLELGLNVNQMPGFGPHDVPAFGQSAETMALVLARMGQG